MWFSIQKWVVRQFRKPKTIVLLLIVALGLIMILLARGNDVVQGIGISLLASGIMSILSIFFINDEDPLKTARSWGLEKVYETRGEMNPSCDNYMEHAKMIKAIGFGFRSLRDSQERDIIEILRKGGKVKLITMKPECVAMQLREADENQNISNSIKDMIEWAKGINAMGLKGQIEIRYHDHLPQNFLFLMNNRLFTGPYEYGKTSQQTISFEYSVTGTAYEYYDRYFERLWNDTKFCYDALS